MKSFAYTYLFAIEIVYTIYDIYLAMKTAGSRALFRLIFMITTAVIAIPGPIDMYS
jgi:hypothetical protein